MNVVSVNVGAKKEINYHGKLIETGIYKYPVVLPIYLGKEDVENDSVIDRRYHGGVDKACYCYSQNHYAFWKQRFPNLEWNYGMFGENLTISDLDESEVKIGDVYQIGSAKVQVTQPRQPCFKLNHRFACDSMVKEFIESGFSGIYLKVLEQGVVDRGDRLVLLERREESLSVKEIYTMLYEAEKDQNQLQIALNDPALPIGCKNDLMK